MREEEIRKELELGVRAFLNAEERSKAEGIDDFDEMGILESSFNRLFLAVEHLCNGLILLETGNFSPKHFGDIQKFKNLKDKYKINFQGVYEETYTFRSYGDYRKFPKVKEKFDKKHLTEVIAEVRELMSVVLNTINQKMNIKDLIEKSFGKEAKQEGGKKEQTLKRPKE
jgi:hypothetical protein